MALGSNFYSVILNLGASAHQTEIIQAIKSRGDDCIQTSNGLCVRSSLRQDEFRAFIDEKAGDGVVVEGVNTKDTSGMTPDVKSFMGF